MLLKIPFYAINSGDGWDNRVSSLLADLDLKHRFVPIDGNIVFSDMDYSDVDMKLAELRKTSIEWLKSSISHQL